jgi:hypothetical protein
MKTVKTHCNKCGYAEKMRKRDWLFSFFRQLFMGVGIFTILFISLVYFVNRENVVVNEINKKLSEDYTVVARQNDNELRQIALELTENCSTGYAYCFAETMYNNLIDLRYVPPSKYRTLMIYHPLYVYENGGDCKNTAAMVVALMGSIGFDAHVDCNVLKKHCVAVVPLKTVGELDYTDIAIMDLAQSKFFVVDKNKDFWKQYD